MKTILHATITVLVFAAAAFGQQPMNELQAAANHKPDQATPAIPYGEGPVTILISPEHFTAFALQQGEQIKRLSHHTQLIYRFTNDLVNGVLRPIINVKPIDSHVRAGVLIHTNKRIYHLRFISVDFKTGRHGFPWQPDLIYEMDDVFFVKLPAPTEKSELPTLYGIGPAGERTRLDFEYKPQEQLLSFVNPQPQTLLTYEFSHPGFMGLYTANNDKKLLITPK